MLFVVGLGSTFEAQFIADSLRETCIDENLQDTIRLDALDMLAGETYMFSNPHSAIHYSQQYYDFAKERGLKNTWELLWGNKGLPMPTDDSVKNTVSAALEMQAFVSKPKTEQYAAIKSAFQMRVGVYTCPLVTGVAGVKTFQYDIWGDTVNTASRMASSSEGGKVNISQTTYELVKDQITCEYRGVVEEKGN